MIAKAELRQYTPEEVLLMPDGDDFELVDGELVERNFCARSSFVAGNAFGFLANHNHSNPSGWLFPEGTSYQCFPNAPGKVRRPDTSFVRFGRFPNEELPEGHILIHPDLAVEVVSPNDTVYEVDDKTQEFLEAGVQLVWVIDPKAETVGVHRADGSASLLGAREELTGEIVLPGFRCHVAELFRKPERS